MRGDDMGVTRRTAEPSGIEKLDFACHLLPPGELRAHKNDPNRKNAS